MTFRLRALAKEDFAEYAAFFAEGARRHPDTLRIAPEDFEQSPFPTEESDARVTLVRERIPDGRWVAVGTLERELGRRKRSHIAWIVRMYAAESGRGHGRAVLAALVDRARRFPGIEKLNLTVAAENTAAVELYASFGFVVFSREPMAFRGTSGFVDELSMTLRF